MSDLRWVIEDGRLWVERTGEGYRAWWDQATADEAATILQSVIASTKERCAAVAENNTGSVVGLTHGAWERGHEAGRKSAASAIRSLQIKVASNHE